MYNKGTVNNFLNELTIINKSFSIAIEKFRGDIKIQLNEAITANIEKVNFKDTKIKQQDTFNFIDKLDQPKIDKLNNKKEQLSSRFDKSESKDSIISNNKLDSDIKDNLKYEKDKELSSFDKSESSDQTIKQIVEDEILTDDGDCINIKKYNEKREKKNLIYKQSIAKIFHKRINLSVDKIKTQDETSTVADYRKSSSRRLSVPTFGVDLLKTRKLSIKRSMPMKVKSFNMSAIKDNIKNNILSKFTEKKSNVISILDQKIVDDPIFDSRLKNEEKDIENLKNKISTIGIDKLKIPEKQLNDLKNEIYQYPISTVLISNDLKILQCNNYFLQKLFQTRDELIDTNLLTHIDIDERNDFELFFSMQDHESIKDEKREDSKFNFQDKNSSKITFTINIRKLKFEDRRNSSKSIELTIIYLTEQNYEHNQVYSDCLIIDPRGVIYLTWSLLILVVINSMLFYLPYSLVFGSLKYDVWWQDVPLTVIFTFDILINMSVGYKMVKGESEEEDDKDEDTEEHADQWNFDRRSIIINYLKGWMLFDIFATFPTDLVFSQVQNTQFFKTVKIIKLVKFLKILRLSKIQQVYQQLVRSRELYSFFKKNQGQMDLIKNMIMIQIAAHFQTIFFVSFQNLTSHHEDHNSWISEEQLPLHSNKEISLYTFMLFENIKTALGLGVINVYNSFEAWCQIFWMCLGLSMQGQGIGNISSQLNQSNKEDILYSTSVNQFTELCSLNNIDTRVHKMVMKELEHQYSKFNDIELVSQGKQLSLRTLVMLESEINKTFVLKFELFQSLNSFTIRRFKLTCKYENKKIVLRKDMQMNEMQFILTGKISIYDIKMNFINQYHSQEIFGITYFYKQLNLKQNIDILAILSRIKDKDLISKAFKRKIISKDENLNSVDKKFDMSSEIIELKKKFKNNYNNVQIRFNYNAIASDDVEFLSIPQSTFEEILLEDIESFQEIYIYHIKQSELISKEDYKSYKKFYNEFNNDEIPAIITLDSGQIYDKNIMFDNTQSEIASSIIGNSIFDVLISKDEQIQNLHELNNGQQTLQLGDDLYKIKILIGGFKKLIQGDIEYNQAEMQIYDQYRYKKSMLNGWIIYLFVEE